MYRAVAFGDVQVRRFYTDMKNVLYAIRSRYMTYCIGIAGYNIDIRREKKLRTSSAHSNFLFTLIREDNIIFPPQESPPRLSIKRVYGTHARVYYCNVHIIIIQNYM